MAIKDIFKFSRKTFFNPGGWIDAEFQDRQARFLWTTLKTVFSKPTTIEPETFEDAMARMQLSEADIAISISRYRIFSYLFLALGCCALFYAFYILFKFVTISGWILALAVTALLWAQAFKYSFWALQMEMRKLGLTFNDWKKSILGE